MGASLLQKVNRDTYSFTMKCSARQDGEGNWHDMSRRPVMPHERLARSGRRAVVMVDGAPADLHASELGGQEDLLQPVWRDGELLRDWTFEDIKARARL